MLFTDILIFSNIIYKQINDYHNNNRYEENLFEIKNNIKISSIVDANKIGIIDFNLY